MKKDKYYQQIHKVCGGELIIIASKKDWRIACEKCLEMWILSSPIFPVGKLPKEFENIKNGITKSVS